MKSLKSRFTYLMTLTFVMVAGVVKGQTYDAPYDILRFQPFIGGSKLQAPTSATVATAADLISGYKSERFYVVEGDKIAFNQSGESMRTELRHETNWNLLEGDRSFHGTLKFVTQTGEQVTVVQIHDDANAGSGPNKPLLRIYRHLTKTPVNHLWAAIKTDDTGENTKHIDLGLAPADYFDWDVILENGELIINIEGVEKAKEDVSFWTFPSYWKAGVYLQNDGEATVYFDQLYLEGPHEVILSADEGTSIQTTIYPNPTRSLVTIDIGEEDFLNGTVTLFNVSGAVQRETTITSRKIKLNMPQSKGLYFIKVEKEGISKTWKVIKKSK